MKGSKKVQSILFKELKKEYDTFKKHMSETLSKPFKSELVSKEEQKERNKSCMMCDRLFAPTFSCKECGCFMKIKTWIKEEKCPLDKW